MGILSDFRKLFFGASSVAKSAKNKAVDVGEEALREGKEKITDGLSEAIEKTEDLAGDVWDRGAKLASDALEEGSDLIGDLKSSKVFKDVKEGGSTLAEKSKDALAGAGAVLSGAGEKLTDMKDKAVEQSDGAWEKIIDGSDKAVENIWDRGSKLADKAKEKLSDLDGKIDATIDKLKAENDIAEEQMRKLDADGDGIADRPIDFGKSEMEKHESFFDKAEDWVERHTGEKATARAEHDTNPDDEVLELGDITIRKPATDAKSSESGASTAGFSDQDGDGDDIIDDAIVDDSE